MYFYEIYISGRKQPVWSSTEEITEEIKNELFLKYPTRAKIVYKAFYENEEISITFIKNNLTSEERISACQKYIGKGYKNEKRKTQGIIREVKYSNVHHKIMLHFINERGENVIPHEVINSLELL